MSDEDERQTKTNMNSFYDINNRRLSTIKTKLQELTREKTKYNVEKLVQDIEFLQSELGHLSHTIADLNKEINAQIYIKKTLNAKMAMLRSNSGLGYTNKEIALRDKERYEKELEKPNKSEVYRDLARRQIKSICEALPKLEIQDEYNQKLQQAEDIQIAAQNKREKLQETLNTKSRKQAELRQLLNDSATKLPELEATIECLRLERDQILTSMNNKKQQPRTFQLKFADPPIQSFATLEQDTLEYEKRNASERLKNIRLLLNYFGEKMSEHHLTIDDQLSSELKSSPTEERTILSSYKDEQDSSTTDQRIHSSYSPSNSIEYKKELPSDILDKYAGVTSKKQQLQQVNSGKKNRKNKKNFGVKHSSQMIVLYNDVRKSSGDSDTLPFMPLFEYELPPTLKALQLMEQSVQSYLNELSKREQPHSAEEEEEEDDDDIRDSALDTFSETSSLIEPIKISNDSTSIIPQLINIPEARSSSSSDDKKTVVSSTSPPSSHNSHSKTEHQFSSMDPLATVEELPPYLPPLTIQIAQMERQISDEGYRSVRNEKQQQHATGFSHFPLLVRSKSNDCVEKVDKWLSSSTPPLSISTDDNFHTSNFQPTDFDNEEEEDSVELSIPVSNH